MKRLVLIGAGGHGKVVADTAESAGYRSIVFVDKSWPERSEVGRFPIVGVDPEDVSEPGDEFFCAIGSNARRERLSGDLPGGPIPVLAHPSAIISPSATIGSGTLLVAGAIVNAHARIGRGVIINTASSVDHDCEIGDFVHISPGARLAGTVSVGARSWIGIGAAVREGTKIGKDVMVGAGAAVVSDIPDGARVGGVPARPI